MRTQEEIADRENLSQFTVNRTCSEMASWQKWNKSDQAAADFAFLI